MRYSYLIVFIYKLLENSLIWLQFNETVNLKPHFPKYPVFWNKENYKEVICINSSSRGRRTAAQTWNLVTGHSAVCDCQVTPNIAISSDNVQMSVKNN